MIRPAALLLFLVGASAAELVVHDMRLGLSTLPLTFDWTIDSRNGTSAGSDGFASGLGMEVGGRWSFARVGDALGVVVGADALVDRWSYADGGALATTGARVTVGPGWAISDRWTLAAMVGLQYGIGRLDMPATVNAPSFTSSGTNTGYDLRIDADYLFSHRFGLGLTAGWLIASHDLSGDDSVIVTLKQSGWFVGLSAVWRFYDVPSRLE